MRQISTQNWFFPVMIKQKTSPIIFCTATKIPFKYSQKRIARPKSQFPHSCVCERFIYFPKHGTHPAHPYCWRWKGIDPARCKLHVHTPGCGNGYTLHVHSVCLSPASAFRLQGSVRYSWSRISPALPSHGYCRWGPAKKGWVFKRSIMLNWSFFFDGQRLFTIRWGTFSVFSI